LSELDSFKIHSLSLSQPRRSSIVEKMPRCKSHKSKITKVYLEKMIEIEEVYFLTKLCPRVTYLTLSYINNIDIELFLRDIFSKIDNDCNQYLRSLCFRMSIADDKIIKKLEKMINCEKLLLRCTIKCVLGHIYLQWK